MPGGSNNYIKRFFNIFKIIVAVFAVLVIASCPEPMTDNLLAEVEDTVGPVISITTPDLTIQNYIESTIFVEGTIVDYSDDSGNIEGSISSASFRDEFGFLGVIGDIIVDSNGDFDFSFPATTITDTFKLLVTATDWNGNTETEPIIFFKDTSGPYIIVDNHEATDYNVYSSSLSTPFPLTGSIGLDAIKLRYDIEWSGTNLTDETPTFVDYSAGTYSFSFIPTNYSGTLTFWLRATDDSNTTDKLFSLTDDPDEPVISLNDFPSSNTTLTVDADEGLYTSTAGATGANIVTETDFDLKIDGVVLTPIAQWSFTSAPIEAATTLQLVISSGLPGLPDGTEVLTFAPKLNEVFDRVGNPADPTISLISENLHDKTPPTVPLTGVAQTTATPIQVEVDFSEDINTTDVVNINYYSNNGNNPSGAALVDSDTVRLTFGSITTGLGLDILGGVIRDLAGNYLVAVNRSIADGIAPDIPTVAIDDTDGYINSTENIAVSFIITGEANASYVITTSDNCTPALFSGTLPGTGISSGLTFTADGDGAVELGVELTDGSSNTSGEGTDSSIADLTVNTPTVTIDDDGDVTDNYINISENNSDVSFTITGEDGATYVVTPSNGTLNQSSTGTIPIGGGSTGTTSGLSFNADASGAVSLSVVLTDLRGNASLAGTGNSTADLTAPTLSIDDNVAAIISDGSDIDFIFTFSEAVWDFDTGDVISSGDTNIVGGNKSSFSGNDGDTVYTVVVVPDNDLDGTDTSIGKVTVTIDVNDATDIAGNTGPASSPNNTHFQRVDSKDPTIQNDTLLTPNGAEEWDYNVAENITWTAGDITDLYLGGGPISFHYRINGGTWVLIDDNEANDGTYNWELLDIVNSDQVEVRITATDLYGNSVNDISDNDFEIDSPPSMQADTLTYPNGGEILTQGTSPNILWTDADIVDTLNMTESSAITLEYTTDGTNWNPIVSSTSDDGSYNSWTVPVIISSTVKIKITATDTAGKFWSDISDSNFSIIAP